MTIYEGFDDYGTAPGPFGKYDSTEFGSAGPRVACCTIRPYYINWYAEKEINADGSIGGLGMDFDGNRRRLEEYYGGEVDVFTPEEFRELFGYEPEKLEGEEEWFAQN